ncbi:lysine N(6)-hydroxylase/L-ornithine N(5)-oxygenase family protein [Actinomadura flavalba]|uniref:lysine N(6)-hydroxylase/L-ornithine N(5)-oxygenase family protein n=1 Tax=Actinomadura flavalba TaxID=1120938 RepID=UPI0003789D7A|nr:SidA/IucD/PvdA family monooxygenase [Actinomadura flavalba]
MSHEHALNKPVRVKCLGIGAGPANLSLASLLHGDPAVPNLFLDAKPSFSWHDGQMLPDAKLQVSHVKDLVTLVDPTSPFSFMNYLADQGRIYHFLNAQFESLPRQEYRNYLEWAAARNENVVYGETVGAVDFDGTDFVVETDRRTVIAENVVVGVGSRPWVPLMARDRLDGTTQLHISEFMTRAHSLAGLDVAVVGGGQSGAEAFLDLVSRPSGQLPGRISWITRRSNYLPIDDSPFTNEFFTPGYSDYFADLALPARQDFIFRHLLASDGISGETARAIYQALYLQRFVNGAEHLTTGLYPNREVVGMTAQPPGGWDLEVRHNIETGAVEHIEADVVIWATGMVTGTMDFLAPLAGRLERESDEYVVDHDFAVRWDGPSDRGVFLQNAVRRQRGLADPNLSLNAWRSRRIADRITGTHTREPLDSFLRWSAKAG